MTNSSIKKTTLCYLEREGKYLMLLRNKKTDDANEGKWIGVGGKFLPGETPLDCVVREVAEETGFTLAEPTFRGLVHFVSDTWPDEDMYLYTANEFEVPAGTPLADGLPLPECDEGTLAWIPVEQVMGLNLWEGDRAFLSCLVRDENVGEMTLHYEGDSLVDVVRA